MILIYYAVISFPQETMERDKLIVCIIEPQDNHGWCSFSLEKD